MLLGRVLRVRRWWDRIDEHLIVGALPLARDVPKLKAEGVSAVVNTCEEYSGPIEQYEAAGIKQLRIPTVDFTPPKLADIEKAVEFINQAVAEGGTAYVHCKAGRARSATVAVCWLVDAKQMSPQEAQALLLEKRPHVHPHVDQRQVVKDFYRSRQR